MERNPYFENYINNLQKDIFLLAFDSNYQIIKFISCYMKSNVRKEMDKPYTSWHNQPPSRILEEIIANNSIDKVEMQTINRDAVEWLGYFYSKWHFSTGESSKTIMRFLNPSEGLKNFYTLHQLDEDQAIERCKRLYNISRNNHRKTEDKNNDESQQRYTDPVYYSFLVARMIYKLTKNQKFNNLNYTLDANNYDFVDDSYSIGIKSDVIFADSKDRIIERYKNSDGLASKYLRKTESSIYFCFVFSSHYETEGNDKQLLLDILEIKKQFVPSKRQFNYLYFYLLGNLYEITPSNEMFTYVMPLSKRERLGILNKMKELGL